MCGERDYTDGSTLSLWFSRISQPPWLSGFPLRPFPPRSLPSCPLRLSPHSQQQTAPWDYFPVPVLQLPAASLSRGLASLSRVCRAAAEIVCVILILFKLSQVSCFTLQEPQILHFRPKLLPWCGDLILASGLQLPQNRSSPAHSPLPTPLPSSYRDLCGSIYSFLMVRYSCKLSAGVLQDFLCLKVYSWCVHQERRTPRPPFYCIILKPIYLMKPLLLSLMMTRDITTTDLKRETSH